MLVRDIMQANVRTTTSETSVRDVAIQMCFNKISGMPVIDDQGHILGIISEKDVLHAMYPSVDSFMQEARVDFEALEAEYEDVVSQRVDDLMTRKVHTVAPDQPVLKAASIMFLNRIRRIPVAEDGRLVGIISMGDVHKAIFQGHLSTAQPQSMEEQNGARAAG